MQKVRFLFFISVGFLVFSCKPKSKAGEDGFDVGFLLQEVTQKVIIPCMEEFTDEASKLSKEIHTYAENPNLEQLETVQRQWVRTAYAYERTYNFHFGPAKSKFLHQAIYNWPTVPNTIENQIESGEVKESNMLKASPQIKGIAALEYLLFQEDLNTTNAKMAQQPERREYLAEAGKFVEAQAKRLLRIWNTEGDNYAQTFINNEASGINNSFNLLFNGLYNAANTAKVTKIGKPGGFEKSPRTNPKKVQAPYSDESLALTQNSIEVIETVFFGKEHPNISQYISSMIDDETTNRRIKTAIEETKQAIAAIPVPLDEAVDAYPAEVENLHAKLTALNIWMGVDARSILSVIITSTDNDGD